jgi:Uncharacterized protein conserved in bacteria (DUF2314)
LIVGEILNAIVSWKTFLVALLVFGFAPGAVLRLIVLVFDRDDPRRDELLAELHAVPRWDRPFWVFEQLEVALFEGIWERLLWAGAGRLYDRWHLDSGVKRNREHPETFEIPDEEDRQAIEPGVVVKLLFDTTDLWGRRNWGERMWVEIVAVKKRHIVGVLDNDPIGIPRLYRGDQVKFRRHHIVGILWRPDIDSDRDDLCECPPAVADIDPQAIQGLCTECNDRLEPPPVIPELPPRGDE